MATVPYTGVPSVAPQDNPTPRMQVSANADAFGAGVAQATAGVGQQISHAGDELFKRGLAMQELYNHSEATAASADFMERAGKLNADYSALQGKDAVAAYPQFVKDLKALRQSIQGGLSNDSSRKLFENDSMNTLGRTIFSTAGYAARENKKYAINAAGARVAADRNAALANPQDEEAFQGHLSSTMSSVRAQYELQGADEDTISVAEQKAASGLWYDRIAGLAKTQPFTADKMLNKVAKDGGITGEDLGKLTEIVRGQMRTVGARQISQTLTSGNDLSWGSKVVSMGQAKNAIGTFESGNNYQSLGVEVPGRGRALGKYQVMPENLPGWLTQAGLPSMTPAEFLNSPKAQDTVFEKIFGGYMEKYGSFNEAASVWFSGKTIAGAGGRKDANNTTVPGYLKNTNAILAKNASLSEQTAKGREIASTTSPDDPLFGDYVEQRIISDRNRTVAIKRDDTWNNRQTVEGGLIGGDSGKLPTTVDELRQMSPEIDAAWDKLPAAEQRRYLGVLAKNNRQDNTMTPERLTEYRRLKGLAYSDPAAFMDVDIVGADLPTGAKKEFINLQQKKKENAEGDPRVTRALSILRPTLEAASLNSRSNNRDEYYKFVGSLQGALEDYSSENKKQPDAKAVQEIGTRLLQEQAGTGWFGTNVGRSKLFNIEPPEKEKKAILADPYWAKNGITPTDEQVRQIYIRQQYNVLYGGKPKAQTSVSPFGPRPPVSQ